MILPCYFRVLPENPASAPGTLARIPVYRIFSGSRSPQYLPWEWEDGAYQKEALI